MVKLLVDKVVTMADAERAVRVELRNSPQSLHPLWWCGCFNDCSSQAQ
uniref:Uncharacterized protein n=1 Tax=Rhizophora mucronata TaxID=61149 RepID=A0A2P2N1Z4_RHIMU